MTSTLIRKIEIPVTPVIEPNLGGCPTSGCNGLVTSIAHPERMEICKTCLGCGKEWGCRKA